MAEQLYVISLTEAQADELNGFIKEKEWSQKLDLLERRERMLSVANDYMSAGTVATRQTNGRASPEAVEDGGEEPVTLRRNRSLPTSSFESTNVPTPLVQEIASMKTTGEQYKQSFKGTLTRGPSRGPAGKTAAPAKSKGEWRISTLGPGLGDVVGASDITFDNFLVVEDRTIKVITKLSTGHVTSVSRVPVRIVLLIDRSGSMLQKIGRDSRHTKITKVKHFAKQLISSLDENDEIALVTFGEEAEVFFPLEKLNSRTRPLLQERVNKLDKGSMTRQTNLSSGLRMALKVFFDGMKGGSNYLESKNSILIFSDGEINAGTVETHALVHEVRQNIRQMVPDLDETQSQWVTISVVTTGSSVSEQAYMLSKTCSSEAYYYINKDAEDPEAELFVPVLLRKTAVAWNISYVIEGFHSVSFVDDKCSRDHRVRLKRSMSGKGPNSEKTYFMYDFPAGHSRQVGVCAEWLGEEMMAVVDGSEVMFKLRVEFTNINGERFWQEQLITKDDVIDSLHQDKTDGGPTVANAAACKHEMQLVSGDVLRSAAEHVKSGDKRKSKAVMLDGQKSLQALLNQYGEQSQESTSSEAGVALTLYAKSVVDNLGALIDTIEKASEGESWNKMKAVSTAIVREAPNASDTIVDASVLCPFPEINHMDSNAMRDPLERLMAKNKKKKRITFGLDTLLEENL